MKHDKICTWLGLPVSGWPPDHYTLLGLSPGEQDVGRIEQHAHERLAKLRCYQLSHPDQATEAMNRLAQAFMCLTDPEAKKAYDRLSSGNGAAAPTSAPLVKENGGKPAPAANGPVVAADDTAVRALTQVDWKNSPPPVRHGEEATAASPDCGSSIAACGLEDRGSANPQSAIPKPKASEVPPPDDNPVALPPAAPSLSEPPVSQPADLLYESARISVEARRGLGTLRALIERIDQTRQLLWTWDQAGRYLNRTGRRLSRLAEQNDLNRWLERIGELMEGFPRILGQPGQPGYRVVAMARLEMTAVMFNMLDPHQREALARDWVSGRVVLLAHRKFLRHEFRNLRRRKLLARAFRAMRAALNDHPCWVSVGVALAALAVAAYHIM